MPDFGVGDKVRLPMGEVATVEFVGKNMTSVVVDATGAEARFPHAALDPVRESVFRDNGGEFRN
jgi:hypothetical protein